MLPSGFTTVMKVQSRDEFRDEIVRFAKDLGFETVSAITVVDRGLGKSQSIAVHNAPAEWSEASVDIASARVDPVMQHCKRNSVPIIWDRETYAAQGAEAAWSRQAAFGYRTGIAMALHMPEGRHFLFGVDRERALPADPGELQRVVADLQLFAVHAQDAAARLLLPPADQPESPLLTPRELEALKWTMEGKTAWEVGVLLGISERTAVLHANNAMHKLGAANKHQAVLKALRLGLLN
jgi:DNA-binding CsgD family transcriptional regulator